MGKIILPAQKRREKDNMIELYTREECELCAKAKTLLASHNINYTEHIIGKHLTREEVFLKFPYLQHAPRKLPLIIDPNETIINTPELKVLSENIIEIGDY
jgi:glutaredoxin